MDAVGFASLQSRITDRPVVTYDPRNAGRSRRDEPTAAVTPEQHAGDPHALIVALGAGPVDVFASSGGAVNALACVERHPDAMRTLVAHEPPAGGALPDRAAISAICADIVATYDASGMGWAMAKFVGIAMHRGQIDDGYLAQPMPSPPHWGEVRSFSPVATTASWAANTGRWASRTSLPPLCAKCSAQLGDVELVRAAGAHAVQCGGSTSWHHARSRRQTHCTPRRAGPPTRSRCADRGCC
ncbi:alpha/beta fold hydrolase [Rhodococcoides kroppenstedtii]|uniref:alpha/beta fold hydrolase n=1 Tax=Rhodococcoides kroppenstedtii TaxID=293050 RepID=UPI003645DDAE